MTLDTLAASSDTLLRGTVRWGELPGVWVVTTGAIDVFALRMHDGSPAGPPQHIVRFEAGKAIISHAFDLRDGDLRLIGRPLAGTRLRQVAATNEPIPSDLLEEWVRCITAALSHNPPPRTSRILEAGSQISLSEGETAWAEDRLVWARIDQGSVQLLSLAAAQLPAGHMLPLVGRVWVRATAATVLEITDSVDDRSVWAYLADLHRISLAAIDLFLAYHERDVQFRIHCSADLDLKMVERAIDQIAHVLDQRPAAAFERRRHADPLLEVCQIIGTALALPPVKAPAAVEGKQRNPLAAIARASRIRTRRVGLRGEWWRLDHGPLLSFLAADRQPVALLPDARGHYQICDADGNRTPVTAVNIETLEPFAYAFFRSFPDRPIGTRDLLRFGLLGSRRDLLAVLAAGLAMGFLALVPAIVTGVVFDAVVPAVNTFKLAQLTLAMVMSVLATAAFQFVRGLAILRIETRMSTTVQAAVWDRLLNLPVPFFRDYSAGDLAARARGIDEIRQILTGTTISSLLGGVFSLLNIGLLVLYDARLAVLAIGLVVVACAVTGGAGYVGLRYERQLSALQARIAGLVLQLLTGISKLRVAGAEPRAFAVWVERFTQQRRVAFQARTISNLLTVFTVLYPPVALACIFAALIAGGTPHSTGTVLAFITAFSGLLAAALTVSNDALQLLRIIPLYEQARPILVAVPEVDTTKADPGELSGAIEVSRVSFRYKADGPLILNDVSLTAHPGEFVAVVGPSGSGKSTLLRLLLGFEQPEAGAVYVDGKDLADLDLPAVRNQIGVVLQNGRLMPGDIFSNIVGSSLLTLDDAWEAAAMAGLDQDIRQMPMGMHTVVSETGGTFSGGQRQRLMIARAIVARPRILLFDEATSALDNRTQAIVSRSLEKLRTTRIVIAHRLSTIANADRVYVIVAGRVVQQGTYADLANQEGPFRELIKRQQV